VHVLRKKDSKCYYHPNGKALAYILNRPDFRDGFFMPNPDFFIYENLKNIVHSIL
jgi:hypothetical protein